MEPTGEVKSKKQYYKQKKKNSKKNMHRARLIVRNLPFATTEDNLREHFQKFGEINEIKLLKKEDGTLLGCGFVQYNLVQKAAKARHHLNGKPFLDRNIECDWALPKDRYQKEHDIVQLVKIKEEPLNDEYEIKAEVNESVVEIKEEIKEEVEGINQDDYKEELNESMDEYVDKEDTDDEEMGEEEEELEEYVSEDVKFVDNNSKPISNDVVEGKTVFIKNVPFSATNDDVKKCMSQFGPLYYAVVCIDQLTEHSRGTAFVKFKNKEAAVKCLSEKGIKLMGNIIECEQALSREQIKYKSDKKMKGPRDSRNLYLVKEGVILAGSKAAESVSAADMAKRLQIEQYKTQMLKNLNMFVARTRLVVHNIPPSWNDAQLKKLFQKHSGPSGVIKEARIMRNMRSLDSNGVGKSKEYAFVTFSTHDAALHALRSLNNNPDIFNINKRPIIAFSIENRSKLQAREKRLANSKLKNPQCKSYDPKAITSNPIKEKNRPYPNNYNLEQKSDEGLSKFSGVKAAFGNNRMRSKFNIKTQAQMHLEQVKKDKKKKKIAITKQPLKQKQKIVKSTKQKLNKFKVDDNFSKLVNSYKQKLLTAENRNSETRKKWYD
ncbi:hypothetical protein RN001_003066 [Aquatica leii]|uniref:RRM domain-containing protein n=1 Tax=Aquatica leii TaxID=1421715 RepID=A0AAN7PEE9_9COLE|nr:hypothetical protein RN001_003066 [Aquatica leii]